MTSSDLIEKLRESIGNIRRLESKNPEDINNLINWAYSAKKIDNEQKNEYLEMLNRETRRNSILLESVKPMVIGQGEYSVLWRMFDPKERIFYAEKRIKPFSADNKELEKRVKEEIETSKELSNLKKPHKNIIIYRGDDGIETVGNQKFAKIRFELLRGKRQRDLMQLPYTTEEIAVSGAETFDAILRMVQCKRVHKDLKPENTMVIVNSDGSYGLKIFDFGIVRNLNLAGHPTLPTELTGTPEYLSAQQARTKDELGYTTDMVALGRILFELTTGKELYPLNENLSAHEQVGDCVRRIIRGKSYREIRSLMPESRTPAQDKLQHLTAKLLRCAEVEGNLDAEEKGGKVNYTAVNKGYKGKKMLLQIDQEFKRILELCNDRHNIPWKKNETHPQREGVLGDIMGKGLYDYNEYFSLCSDEKRKV